MIRNYIKIDERTLTHMVRYSLGRMRYITKVTGKEICNNIKSFSDKELVELYDIIKQSDNCIEVDRNEGDLNEISTLIKSEIDKRKAGLSVSIKGPVTISVDERLMAMAIAYGLMAKGMEGKTVIDQCRYNINNMSVDNLKKILKGLEGLDIWYSRLKCREGWIELREVIEARVTSRL